MNDWANMCRRIFEQTLGRVVPADVAGWTIDQFLLVYLDGKYLGDGPATIDENEAVAEGYIEPGKSAYELAQEAEAKRVAGERRAARRSRRKARVQEVAVG